MSTRAIYHFTDKSWNIYDVYKHHDNYPSGAYEAIKAALKKAWALPRFEADEFAAGFIAANKDYAGGVRLVPHGCSDMGQDYDYNITCKNDELWIEFEDRNENDEPIYFKGTLDQMKIYIDKDK